MYSYINLLVEYHNEKYKIVKAYIPSMSKNEIYALFYKKEKELNLIVNKNAIKVNRDSYENCGFIYMVDCGDVALCLDKLAKQFGVEIKEGDL